MGEDNAMSPVDGGIEGSAGGTVGLESPGTRERRLAFPMSESLRASCFENGISEEQFIRNSYRTLSLDAFSCKLDNLDHLAHFTG